MIFKYSVMSLLGSDVHYKIIIRSECHYTKIVSIAADISSSYI